MNSWLSSAIGWVVTSRRRELGLTLAQVAAQAGLSVRDVMTVERGRCDPDLIMLNEVCCVLDVTVAHVLSEAYNHDNERLLVCTKHSIDLDKMRRSYRDVLFSEPESLSLVFLRQRIDTVVIDTEYASMLGLEQMTPRQRGRLGLIVVGSLPVLPRDLAKVVSTADVADWSQLTDRVLQATPKGQICRLRRMQDQLCERRGELELRREQLVQNQTRLHETMKSLLAKQTQILEVLSSRRTVPDEQILQIMKRLEKHRTALEALTQKLATEDAELLRSAEFARHRELFLARQQKVILNQSLEV